MQVTEDVRRCSEERQTLSQQLSEKHKGALQLQETVDGLERTISELQSKLHESQQSCEASALSRQAECDNRISSIEAKFEDSANQAHRTSHEHILEITSKLEEEVRIKSQHVEENEQCQIKSKQQSTRIHDLEEQLGALEGERELSERSVSALSTVREESVKLGKQLEEERAQCHAASVQAQAQHDKEITSLKERIQAAGADFTSSKADADALATELHSCRATLQQETDARTQAEAQAVQQEKLKAQISSECKQQEEKMTSSRDGMQACIPLSLPFQRMRCTA